MTLVSLLDSQVYQMLVNLRAVKRCEKCGEWRSVATFGKFGEPLCEDCRCAAQLAA